MKKYNITVNGNKYEVEVDEVGGVPELTSVAAQPAPSATPAAAPSQPAAPAPAPAPASSAPSADATVIESPMPGTIIDLIKKPGDEVADSEVVLILEAMKMENEIVAPRAGVIDAIPVVKGSSVNAGDVLFSIK